MNASSLFLILFALAVTASPIKRQVVLDPAQVDAASASGAPAVDGAVSVPAGSAASSASTSIEGAVVASPTGSAISAASASTEAPVPAPSDAAGQAPPAEAPAEGADTSAAAPAAGSADLTVVKFAALAESLESSFYDAALKKFSAQSFSDAGFADGQAIFDQLGVVLADEQTHLTTLQAVAASLGGSTSDVDSCTFNFDAALTDVPTFLATARVLEFVGVDAYIGGTTLIDSKSLLVSAAQITTVEARHNTVLNLLNGGTTIPNAFDMVLTPQQVLSVAAPFVSGGCDVVAALGLTPTPALTVTNTEQVLPGTLVTFGGAGLDGQDTANLFCNMIVGGATEAIVLKVSECVVPEGLDGPVHLFVTNSETPLSSNIVNQDASIIVAGPAIAFIDSIPNKMTASLKMQAGAGSQTLQAGEVAPASAPGSAEGSSSHAPAMVQGGHESQGGGGKKVIITKVTVTKTRHGLGISKPVDGGHGGAVALGWY